MTSLYKKPYLRIAEEFALPVSQESIMGSSRFEPGLLVARCGAEELYTVNHDNPFDQFEELPVRSPLDDPNIPSSFRAFLDAANFIIEKNEGIKHSKEFDCIEGDSFALANELRNRLQAGWWPIMPPIVLGLRAVIVLERTKTTVTENSESNADRKPSSTET